MNETDPARLVLRDDTVRHVDPVSRCRRAVRAKRVVSRVEIVNDSARIGAAGLTVASGVAAKAGDAPTQVKEVASSATAIVAATRADMVIHSLV